MQPVFVGDVQGCDAELGELLDRLADILGADGFELWLVGDLVNRGPASLAVLRRVRALASRGRARVVLGNHEVNLLACFFGLRKPSRHDTFGDVLSAPDAQDWIDWIRSWPLAEAAVLGERRFAMLHAAAAPSWSLDELSARARRVEAHLGDSLASARALLGAQRSDRDRDALGLMTRCRTIDASGRWQDEEPKRPQDAWHARWSAAHHDYGIVYGHWSLQGLHVTPLLRGLDTGCVHHGRDHDGFLTAWIPNLRARDPFAVPETGRLVQVPARRPYYRELLESLGERDSS